MAFWCGKIGIEVGWSQLGGWTKRVGFVATFRLAGAGKSVLEVVGVNLEDGQNVLVL